MADDPITSRDELVLVTAPMGRDGHLACDILSKRAGIQCIECADVPQMCAQIALGCGAVILAEEAIDSATAVQLIETLTRQLTWSDLPVIILASTPGAAAATTNLVGNSALPVAALRKRGNVTVLDRPLRIVTLVTAVQSALRARRRQYEVRDLLTETRNAVRQRDQFLAMLGHELRNPLGAISNAMNVIDVANPSDDALEQEQREIVRRQTEHLARLVDDLLDVSRITSGKIALQRSKVDLCDVVRSATKAVEAPMRAQRHQLNINLSCEPVTVDVDPVRLEQVINNLLTNAIKYTPTGGRIELSVEGDATSAILRLRDNGIGMTPDLLPRVFDLFTQAERALDRSQGGLGIGLTLVRTLVEMHGGHVNVTSEGPGMGSEFTIILPRVDVGVRRAPAAQVAPSVNGNGGRRVLIIEDQPDARRALQRLLQLWGHHVDVAEDGIRGVETAATCAPDVAFVDVGLPGLDGYEVARRIRATLGDRVKLIALTGYGQPEDRERALSAGFDLHLVKPVDRDQLARSVADHARSAT